MQIQLLLSFLEPKFTCSTDVRLLWLCETSVHVIFHMKHTASAMGSHAKCAGIGRCSLVAKSSHDVASSHHLESVRAMSASVYALMSARLYTVMPASSAAEGTCKWPGSMRAGKWRTVYWGDKASLVLHCVYRAALYLQCMYHAAPCV